MNSATSEYESSIINGFQLATLSGEHIFKLLWDSNLGLLVWKATEVTTVPQTLPIAVL